jgi:TPP-dependent pyruvate/acetoin dehydrogenase alpha subunit
LPVVEKQSEGAKGKKGTSVTPAVKPAAPLTNGASHATDLSSLAGQVALSEQLDLHLAEWQRRGQMGFFLPAGEWAAALAGIAAALEPKDWVFPGAREGRVAIHRGLSLVAYLGQHLGLEVGKLAPEASSAGHAQPGSIADAAHRVASTPSGSANHLPQAVGAAMAAVKRKTTDCAVAICGQSGIDADDFHVAANFAGVFKAPVLFVVRAEAGEANAKRVLARAEGYGLIAASADGTEATVVRAAVHAALAKARQGKPGLLVLSPPAAALGARPLAKADAAQRAELRRKADEACEKAFAATRDGVRPGLASLTRGVFAEETRSLAEQLADLAGEQPIPPEEV